MKKKIDFTNVRMHVFSILFILFVLVELQIMINYSEQFIWFVGVGCLILIDVYLLICTSMKKKEKSAKDKDDQFESISKSEKASYLLLKKCFQDLDERMNRLENIILPISNSIEINARKLDNSIAVSMEEQKKIAKLIIARNKENADAMMNSNEYIDEKISLLSEKLSQLEEKVLNLDITVPVDNTTADTQQHQELLSAIREIEASVKAQLEDMIHRVPVASGVEVPEIEPVPELEPELEPMPELEIEPMPEPEPEPVVELEPEPMPELEPIVEEAPAMPEMSDPNKMMSPDDIAALLASLGGDSTEEAAPEPEIEFDTEVDLMSEPEPMPEPEPEPVVELEPEPMPEPEPIIEEPLVMPDMSDPNKMMSPDDIAALLASLGGDSTEEASFEPEPEPIMEPMEEEKPPMPDMSDPNKVMTPEEIAALIANM